MSNSSVLKHQNKLVFVFLITVAILFALWHLDALPPVWWDEGWNLCVARNWAVQGHYGCLLNGQPAPPVLAGSFWTIAPVSLSFWLFGVGIWQGRIVGLVFMAGVMVLLYYLSTRLYNRTVAVGVLILLVLFPVKWQIHPFIIGRQVLGEMPSLFYLLLGYICFLFIPRKAMLFIPLTLIFWGIALDTKSQVQPFWVVSLALPLIFIAIKRQWKLVALLIAVLIGTIGVYQLQDWLQESFLAGNTLPREGIHGLRETLAVVPDIAIRLGALRFAAIFGLLTLIGLGYATWKWLVYFQKNSSIEHLELTRLMLLTLSGSWFVWFVLLSIGWDRYAFSPLLLATPFIVALFYDLTNGFNFRTIGYAATNPLKTGHIQQNIKAVIAIALFSLLSLLALRSFYLLAKSDDDTSMVQTVEFLNTAVASDAVIETYDSELFFLLERPYHYPPDQVHVELIRRMNLSNEVNVEYNPLASDPDYLVIGAFSAWVRLYEPVLENGSFRLLRTIGNYQIYERVR